MAQILTGRINLSKIPADLIQKNDNGDSFLWVDVAERREASQYGDTHYISIYDKQTRQKIYLGDLRPRDLGGDTAARPSAFPPAAPAAPAIPNYRPMSGRDEAEPTPADDLPFNL